MALNLEISGPKAPDQPTVERVLDETYEARLGVHNVRLHYVPGQGYQIVSATKQASAGGAYGRGDGFERGRPEDIAAEVKHILRQHGFAVVDLP